MPTTLRAVHWPKGGVFGRRRSMTTLGVLCLSAVALLRPIEAGTRFTFWGEDGVVFTTQPRSMGIWSSIHTTYVGYLQLVPRLVAAISAGLPLAWSPAIYAVAASAVAGGASVISYICSQRGGFGRPAACLIAAATLLLAAGGYEPIDNLTNVQWFCLAAVIVFTASWMVGYQPRMRWTAPLLVVAGLTSPLLIIPGLAMVVVLVLRRTRYDLAVTGSMAVAIGAQALARLSSPAADSLSTNFTQAARMYSVRASAASLTGDRLLLTVTNHLGFRLTAVVGLLLPVFIIVAAFIVCEGRRRAVVAFLVVSSASGYGIESC